MNDLELVQKCSLGDQGAWNEFINRYTNLICGSIYSILKKYNLSLARQENVEEIYQEIFASLTSENCRRLLTFKAKNGSSLATWLKQVAIRSAISYLRNLKPAISLDKEVMENLTLNGLVKDEKILADELAIQEDDKWHLEDCIEKLVTDDKFFVEFHFKQGLSHELMAKLLNISRAAVDMRRMRIIQRLKDCFKSKGFALDF